MIHRRWPVRSISAHPWGKKLPGDFFILVGWGEVVLNTSESQRSHFYVKQSYQGVLSNDTFLENLRPGTLALIFGLGLAQCDFCGVYQFHVICTSLLHRPIRLHLLSISIFSSQKIGSPN